MSSIVLQLQQELISGNCDILNALRRAHIIAVKLKLGDFDKWINQELNGYGPKEEVPNYRKVRGALYAFNPYRGWTPTMIPNAETEKLICNRDIVNSISSLIELYANSKDSVYMSFNGEMLELLNRMFSLPMDMQFSLHINKSCLKEILEHVKDTLLQWTLKLEEMGILGEGLKFTEKEKTIAKDIIQTVNNYFGATSVINSPSNSQIVTAENVSIEFDYVEAEKNIAELRNKIESEDIEESDKNDALEIVDEIGAKIKAKKNPGIIKSALSGLKDFLISLGAGVAAEFILRMMQA